MSHPAFEMTLTAGPEHIDELGHVNNAVWVQWIQQVAVTHWDAVADAQHKDAYYWIVVRHEIDYLRAAVLGDRVLVGTWIADTDGKLRVQRRFQVRRATDGETLARARTHYVCINLDSGRAARMPEILQRAYIVTLPA